MENLFRNIVYGSMALTLLATPVTAQQKMDEMWGYGRVVWKVETDEGQMAQNQQSASSIFCKRPIGWIRFDKPGRHTITVSMPEGGEQANMSAISMTPIYFE